MVLVFMESQPGTLRLTAEPAAALVTGDESTIMKGQLFEFTWRREAVGRRVLNNVPTELLLNSFASVLPNLESGNSCAGGKFWQKIVSVIWQNFDIPLV